MYYKLSFIFQDLASDDLELQKLLSLTKEYALFYNIDEVIQDNVKFYDNTNNDYTAYNSDDFVENSMVNENNNIVDGLIIEPLFNDNTNTFLSWENVRHSMKLEIIWTILPTVILFFVAVPSFSLLYGYDESVDVPVVTLKVIGHQ